MRAALGPRRATWRSAPDTGRERSTCLMELICCLAVSPSAPRVKAEAAKVTRKKVLSLLASDSQQDYRSHVVQGTCHGRNKVDFGLLDWLPIVSVDQLWNAAQGD